ncbi:DUF2911 domain-containing protein [Gillisia hiemivivida]|uniref:DUF2911 domain-containing protein n=1 Tax=Gillisia hiemivivida TaxID=291190 RepID=A0A5C6ZUG8_9FLAO|nr:DUF2911 domain-containing protein [Gillisia hiemivivida]TXD92482.1 DUF2911 domain-containing protein [Gillisia hiemivivida]
MKNSQRYTIIKIIIAVIAVVIGGVLLWRYSTKAHSPEDSSVFSEDSLKMEVVYNRPYKKGREVFGGLVPYGEVWRTGANEATTFSTNKDVLVDGSPLKSGTYTLWTIPMQNSWKVIFNSKMYPWGINLEKKASRDPNFDVLVLEVPITKVQDTLEQFSIYFEKSNDLVLFYLAWDDIKISVPIKNKKTVQKNNF